MKLIDANTLKQDMLALPDCDNGFSDTYDKSLIIGLIDEQVVVDAIPVVRCKDCKYKPIEEKYTHTRKMKYGFADDVWVETIVKSPVDFSPCPCIQDDEYYSWVPDDNWFCANGERK